MRKINVVGLGPGHRKYITPAAVETLEKSSFIAGGARNLKSLEEIEGLNLSEKELYEIKGPLENMKNEVLSRSENETVSVIATGDPGFYGILAFMKRELGRDKLEVVPGISSMQYLFAKLGIVWHDAYLGSVHGRDEDIIGSVKSNSVSLFLTDTKNSYREIAETLSKEGLGDLKMYVGANLSYPEEEIIEGKAEDFLTIESDSKLAIVVIENE